MVFQEGLRGELRGLYYCQPVFGVGQLVRSLNICKTLIKNFAIDYLWGGPDHFLFPSSLLTVPNFHLHSLPPLWVQAVIQQLHLIDPHHQKTVEQVFEQRKETLAPILQQTYHFFMIEVYPFGKRPFGKEIEWAIQQVKKINPQCLIICSLKDITGRQTIQHELKIIETLTALYDYIFVHADPMILHLQTSFSQFALIEHKTIFTGYVADPDSLILPSRRKKQIIVSNGAGGYGNELLRAVLNATLLLKDYNFIFVLGAFTPSFIKQDLMTIQQNLGLTHVSIENFVAHFPALLSESSLSISLGGSTMIDAVLTQTTALVYADAHVEHQLRAERFAQKGAITILKREYFAPPLLAALIRKTIDSSYNCSEIDLKGSINTAKEILNKIIKN